VIWADLHDVDLVVEADFVLGRTSCSSAQLVLSNFSVTTSGDETGNKSHVFGDFHGVIAETTILETKRLALSVWVPVIMGLIVSMVLVEGVIQVTVDPIELGHMSEEVGHLRIIIWSVVVSGSDRVQCLVDIRVDNGVTYVVMSLLPKVLWQV